MVDLSSLRGHCLIPDNMLALGALVCMTARANSNSPWPLVPKLSQPATIPAEHSHPPGATASQWVVWNRIGGSEARDGSPVTCKKNNQVFKNSKEPPIQATNWRVISLPNSLRHVPPPKAPAVAPLPWRCCAAPAWSWV